MINTFWWLRQALLILAGCFFLAFGIHILIAAYKLNDPYSFVMAFFASNLIILISATLILGFVLRMIRVYRRLKEDK
jgi:di/tricarboxylate transporter